MIVPFIINKYSIFRVISLVIGVILIEVCFCLKKKRNIFIQSLFFLILLFISYMFILGVPKSNSDKFDMIVPILLIGILIYIINRITLKRSYKKNKNM